MATGGAAAPGMSAASGGTASGKRSGGRPGPDLHERSGEGARGHRAGDYARPGTDGKPFVFGPRPPVAPPGPSRRRTGRDAKALIAFIDDFRSFDNIYRKRVDGCEVLTICYWQPGYLHKLASSPHGRVAATLKAEGFTAAAQPKATGTGFRSVQTFLGAGRPERQVCIRTREVRSVPFSPNPEHREGEMSFWTEIEFSAEYDPPAAGG